MAINLGSIGGGGSFGEIFKIETWCAPGNPFFCILEIFAQQMLFLEFIPNPIPSNFVIFLLLEVIPSSSVKGEVYYFWQPKLVLKLGLLFGGGIILGVFA